MFTWGKDGYNRNSLGSRGWVLRASWVSSTCHSDAGALDLQTVHVWEDGPECTCCLYSMYLHMFGMCPGGKEERVLLTSRTREDMMDAYNRSPKPPAVWPSCCRRIQCRYTRGKNGRPELPEALLSISAPQGGLRGGQRAWEHLSGFCTTACCIRARVPWRTPAQREGKDQNVAAACFCGNGTRIPPYERTFTQLLTSVEMKLLVTFFPNWAVFVLFWFSISCSDFDTFSLILHAD